MSERVKTILLILFIAGVIGAFNAIISLSQNTGTNPWQTVGQALGLTKKPTPEPGRKFDFIAGELSKNQPAVAPAANSSGTKPIVISSPTPKPTQPPKSQPIQTTIELPPLPPVGGKSLGVSTVANKNLPPLPPIKTLGAKTEIPSLESELQGFLKSAGNFLGF